MLFGNKMSTSILNLHGFWWFFKIVTEKLHCNILYSVENRYGQFKW